MPTLSATSSTLSDTKQTIDQQNRLSPYRTAKQEAPLLKGEKYATLKTNLLEQGFRLTPTPEKARGAILLLPHRHAMPEALRTTETDRMAEASILKVRSSLVEIDKVITDLPIFRERLTEEAIANLHTEPCSLGDSAIGLQDQCVWFESTDNSAITRPFYAAEMEALNKEASNKFLDVMSDKRCKKAYQATLLNRRPWLSFCFPAVRKTLQRFNTVQSKRENTLVNNVQRQGFLLSGVIFGYHHTAALQKKFNAAGYDVYTKDCAHALRPDIDSKQ